MTRRYSVKGRSLRLVSLYSGAGGMDYGFEAAGFETAVAVEMDHACCETLRANRQWPVLEKNIHATKSDEILDASGLKRGEADLLIGGPPCQPFSKSAYWVNGDTKRLSDPRARTLDEYMRCVEDLLPKTFVLENVYGISYSGKEEGFHFLEREILRINQRQKVKYAIAWKVINTAHYGVPQIRERFFLVGHRDGQSFNFPEATHGEPSGSSLFDADRMAYATAWDALHSVQPDPSEDLRVRGYWADLLPSIPEGENYLWHTPRKGGVPLFGWRTRYWSFLLKLAKDKPSWTVQAQPGPAIGPFHWSNRLLSVRELANIQTFPQDVRILGSRNAVQRQLGNAVPSLIAEVLGREIRRQFFADAPSSQPLLAVRPKRPIPAPEAVMPVPRKYKRPPSDEVADYVPRAKKRELRQSPTSLIDAV